MPIYVLLNWLLESKIKLLGIVTWVVLSRLLYGYVKVKRIASTWGLIKCLYWFCLLLSVKSRKHIILWLSKCAWLLLSCIWKQIIYIKILLCFCLCWHLWWWLTKDIHQINNITFRLLLSLFSTICIRCEELISRFTLIICISSIKIVEIEINWCLLFLASSYCTKITLTYKFHQVDIFI